MLALIAAHFAAAALAPALVSWLRRRALLLLAVVPAAGFVWAAAMTGEVRHGDAVEQRIRWVETLGLELSFRLTTLTWVMTLLVTGVGALVLAYCAAYFRRDDAGLPRFAGLLTAFAGAMLGLVIADDLLVLYVFWELTTVLSYLLIGHNPERKANRRAAMQALMVTTFGGLAMLVGVIVIGQAAGTYRISEVLANPPGGDAVTVAVVLVLIGAVSKSALIPFHFWLPGAMAAPTPVSAYLHAAAMVKAGVYLVALFAPAFAGLLPWRPLLLTLGVLTMLLGGLRALRQTDLKLLLAYGTVSQLGFLVVLVGAGTRAAAMGGVAMLVAHALFKAALFLVVGLVDRATGTRDLRELSGLGRRLPVLMVTSVLAAASMAAIPPLAGFVAKETAYAAAVDIAETGDGTGVGTMAGWALVAGLAVGSALTAAYSIRFVWGAFAVKPGVPPIAASECRFPTAGFSAAPVVLAAAGLALGFLGPAETELLEPYAALFPEGAHEPELSLWHGVNTALLLSIASVLAGIVLFRWRNRVDRWQGRLVAGGDAEVAYRAIMRGVDRLAVEVTGATQRGSLPSYLAVIFLVVVAVPGGVLVAGQPWTDASGGVGVRAWDNVGQAVVGAIMIASAVLAARSRRRLKAVLLAGGTGYGMAMLFILHGAPDLALTQVLVETVTLVIFVLVLRRLPTYFSDRPLTKSRWWRMGLGIAVGLVMAGLALAAAGARTAEPVSDGFAEPAVSYGGGHNIVNVTLVDIRAWDTMGEISVLVVAATGVASLIFLITSRNGRWRPDDAIASAPTSPDRLPHRNLWLRAGRTVAPEGRSIMFEVVTRLAFHVVIVFSIYLLFVGHNEPGGGFAGGLVAGLALMVRYLAGGRHELNEAAPVDAGLVLGIGLFIATGSGLVPLAFGGDVLQSAVVDFELPLVGHVHFVTSLFFDVGVYLVVVGLMLDVLRSLGGGVDKQAGDDAEPGETIESAEEASTAARREASGGNQ
ncbi:Na+/H+ antiporter subunit A [Jiangella aurantiaca]|uniref:Na+/H+ antiporter subunit A n=1 Tax=Jiangella aurantiaca TaxID=2530373 RepID=A0A4R5AFN7_9ACTN|nr:Na+/H+ antiporter subunit A [Jiangella aurantiaca]